MRQKSIYLFILLFIILFSAGYRYFNPSWSCEQLYLQQAVAFTQGEFSITVKDDDTAVYNNQYYVPYPPTPALIFTPFVYLFGPSNLIAYALAALAFFGCGLLAYNIGLKLHAQPELSAYLSLALAAGTGLWMCFQYSYSAAYNAHLFSALFILAAFHEALARKRLWLIGLLLGAAATTRPFSVLAGLFLLGLMWKDQTSTFGQKARDIGILALWASPFFVADFLFNFLRFGHLLETGYGHIPALQSSSQIFDLRYIPRNLYTIFLRGPTLDPLYAPMNVSTEVNFPYGIIGSEIGTSLTFASPFLLFSLFAPKKQTEIKLAWISVILCLMPITCYIATGLFQLNCARYALDFMPTLFVMSVIGVRQLNTTYQQICKKLCLYAITLNIIFLTPFLAFCIKHYVQFLMSLRS